MQTQASANVTAAVEHDYVVVGLGLTGRSVLRFLGARGARVAALDTRETVPGQRALLEAFPHVAMPGGGLDEDTLQRAGCIVLSPGVAPSEPAIARAAAAGVRVIGDIELFAAHADAPVIAITGTNGKSTVTTLVGEMLLAAGLDVRRGGNLGPPALDLLGGPPPDAYVLELSSFQLETTSSLAPRVACVLNVTPDHLDRHGSLEAYARAKGRVLEHAAVAVLNDDDEAVIAMPCSARRVSFSLSAPGPHRYGLIERGGDTLLAVPGGAPLLAARELALAGRHNLGNALAALAVCDAFGVEVRDTLGALRRFAGLEHRSERVAEIDGVIYVNDSKGTNPGAACAALEGLGKPGAIVLVAGGVAKGADFTVFAERIAEHARAVVVLGHAAQAIADALSRALEKRPGAEVPTLFATSMDAAVRAAAEVARPGDTVLLSPACASFDMFENYEDRGRAFRAAVRSLGAP